MFANLFGRGQNVQFNAAGTAPRTPLRIPLRVGFVSKPISTAKLTTTFQTRLTKLPALSALGPIEVSMDGSTVVLRGSVASEDDRQLAQDLALLEPAIENVRNELSIQAPETEAAP